jgi:hypothetical protein
MQPTFGVAFLLAFFALYLSVHKINVINRTAKAGEHERK